MNEKIFKWLYNYAYGSNFSRFWLQLLKSQLEPWLLHVHKHAMRG
jgi:hypothetical protein